MKLQNTLILSFTLLFNNNVYAISEDAAACYKAFDRGDLSTSATLSSKALRANDQDRDALICQGRTLSAHHDLNGALLAFNKADALSVDAFDKTVIALITSHAYKAENQLEQALASYQQAITYSRQAKYPGFERMSDIAIGDIHFQLQKYDLALAFYKKANELDANDNERGESYEKIAFTYHTLKQDELALENQVKAFLMHEKAGTLDQYAHSSVELGRYYVIAKKYDSAENVLNKIIKFAKEQGGQYYEAKGSYVLALSKAARGDTPAAKTLVDYAKGIAQAINDTQLAEEITKETQGLF
jgi:tetratricopeptide (TPR) repeat protein